MTTTTISSAGSVEYASAPQTRTISAGEYALLEAERDGLLGKIGIYAEQAATVDREFWLLLRQGCMIQLAAIEDRMGVPRTFVRRKR